MKYDYSSPDVFWLVVTFIHFQIYESLNYNHVEDIHACIQKLRETETEIEYSTKYE